MKGKDEIKDLFSDKLGNFEAPVRPDLWTNIASQIGTGTTAVASTSLSLLTKSIIGVGIISAAVVTAIVVITPNSTIEEKKNTTANVVDITENEPIKEIEAIGLNEKSKRELEKSTDKTDKNKSPKIIESVEIDQNQNFKTDISLIDALKERKENGFSEKKEETIKKEIQQKETTKVIEENKAEIKESSKAITEGKKIEEKKVEKAYTLGDLPNVFTPNGDGNNDVLFIESEGLEDFTIVILDAKQKVVFESNDPNFKWNGVDKYGNTVTAGSYGYYIIARDKNGNKVNKFVALDVRL